MPAYVHYNIGAVVLWLPQRQQQRLPCPAANVVPLDDG
jgi:hypothetical protein